MTTATRADIEAAARKLSENLAIADALLFWRRLLRVQSGADLNEFRAPVDIGHEAEVPDTAKAARQDVKQEAGDELIGLERHHLRFAMSSIISPAKTNLSVLAVDEAAVANRDTMGIAAKIVENLACASERLGESGEQITPRLGQ